MQKQLCFGLDAQHRRHEEVESSIDLKVASGSVTEKFTIGSIGPVSRRGRRIRARATLPARAEAQAEARCIEVEVRKVSGEIIFGLERLPVGTTGSDIKEKLGASFPLPVSSKLKLVLGAQEVPDKTPLPVEDAGPLVITAIVTRNARSVIWRNSPEVIEELLRPYVACKVDE